MGTRLDPTYGMATSRNAASCLTPKAASLPCTSRHGPVAFAHLPFRPVAQPPYTHPPPRPPPLGRPARARARAWARSAKVETQTLNFSSGRSECSKCGSVMHDVGGRKRERERHRKREKGGGGIRDNGLL
ncbi:unnamed protein product [Protopolystoma xenopodis]|uniref:Uncharacterized protein n=1 Tax=Protopolystoma xenopodis TaxID=117903 RepID=A0A3S5FGL5_9PLAT|nr:unnamed protein product [Protopolystoma xenopodis]